MKKTTQALILTSTLLGWSSSSHCFDLKDALNAARENSSELLKQRYELEASEQQVPLARANLLPQVGANVSYTKQNQSKPVEIKQSSQTWRISASQTIFDLNKWYRYQQSKIGLVAANQQFDLAEQQLLMKVSEAYFNILLAKESLATAQKAKASFLMQQEQAEARFKKGVVAIIDVQEAQSGYESAVADEIEITSQLIQAYNRLYNYTHLDARQIESIVQGDIVFPTLTLQQWNDKADQNNLEIQLQDYLIQRSEQELKSIKSQYYPTVELSTGYSKNPNKSQGNDTVQNYDTQSSYISLGVNVPLFSGGQTRAQQKQADANFYSAQVEMTVIKEKIQLSVAENFAKVESGKRRIQALEKLVQTNQTKVDSSALGARYGLLNNVDKIRAEKELYDAKLKLTQAKYQYFQAEISLIQLAGDLGPSFLITNSNLKLK